MADRFDKFTERARKVLQLSQEEAQRFNHNYIGTEHLLLGLVREDGGVAARVLANLGVEPDRVRSEVELVIARGDRTVAGAIGLTPPAKKVLELAVDEARRLNHRYIGTEHLLLGVVREGGGIAAGVLEPLGVSLHKVRSQVNDVLNRSRSSSAHGPQAAGETPSVDQPVDPPETEAMVEARAGDAGQASAMPEGSIVSGPKPAEQHQRLRALVGTWLGEDTLHPSAWDPEGGTATTIYTGRFALNGLFVIGDDIQTRDGATSYLAHKVFGWDNAAQEYTFYLVDSTGQNSATVAHGTWEGDTLTFLQQTPDGQVRYAYTFEGDRRYTFRMDMSPDGIAWRTFVEGTYRRV